MALSDYDKQVREAGYNYIPRTEFLLNPFKIPESKPIVDTEKGGIPTLIPRDSGDGFNPYNTDMSTIRQDFNPYEARQAEEIYSKTFNPRSLPGPQMPDELVGISPNTVSLGNNRISASQLGINLTGGQVRNAYNRARNAMNMRGDDTMSRDYPEFTAAEVARLTNDSIQDYRQTYGAQGQYDSPYDPRYSSMTEAQKFMDNYPDYYGVPSGVPEAGIPAAIRRYMQDSLVGKGLGAAKGFVENILPFNERAVLEDQARGAGIFTDDIGRIVTDDYNTAGGIMAGYNLNQIDADTFDKRRQTIMENMSDRINPETGKTFKQERLDLLDEAEENILGARKKTKLVKKLRKDKKAADKKRKEEEEAAAAAAAAKAEADRKADIQRIQSSLDDTGVTGSDYNQAANIAGGGGGDTATYGGQTAREATYDNDPSTGTSQGYSQHYMDGGRVYYMDGGLADLVDIYD